jgi:negative regulator of sigma E activity
MNPNSHRLGQQARTEAETAAAGELRAERREFSTVEEMLRHDAAHHPPPQGLAERVAASVRAEPTAQRPWWRRWFAGGSGPGRGAAG